MEGGTGLLLAGTDNRWKAGPALQGKRGEKGEGWVCGGQIDGWVGEGNSKWAWCMKMTRICGLCFSLCLSLLFCPFYLRKQWDLQDCKAAYPATNQLA